MFDVWREHASYGVCSLHAHVQQKPFPASLI